jgi:hypothetical protein
VFTKLIELTRRFFEDRPATSQEFEEIAEAIAKLPPDQLPKRLVGKGPSVRMEGFAH